MLPQRLAQLFCVRKQLEKEGETPLGWDLEHLSQSPLLKLSLGASSAKGGKTPQLKAGFWGCFLVLMMHVVLKEGLKWDERVKQH